MPFIRQSFQLNVIAVRIDLYLVLQGAVLPFGLFPDNDEVQVVVACAVAGQTVHMNHICKEV